MKEYKYSLRGGSKKDICPQCGRRTYKPYVDSAGTVLSQEVGRCDRANKCRYHLPPAEWFKRNNSLFDIYATGKRIIPSVPPPRIPDIILREDMYSSFRCYEKNPLVSYLTGVFSRWLGAEMVEEMARLMGIGTSRHFGGSTIFWLIDKEGKIRDGKVMGYDARTGKRIKRPRPLLTNVHTLLADRYSGHYKGCYFGSHLVKTYNNSYNNILLFESEKAAFIFFLLQVAGKFVVSVPIATGGCSAFNPSERNFSDPYNGIQVLAGKEVTLFPDEGKFDEWRQKAEALKGFCKSVYVSDILEPWQRHKLECEVESGDGFDDIILRYIAKGLNPFDIFLSF